jgi:hypothetical protein
MNKDAEPTRAQLVDEFAELREKVKQWRPNVNPHLARFCELGAIILSWYEKTPADEGIIAEGERYKLPISARHVKRSIRNVAAFFKLVGQRKFLTICSVTLGAIEKEVPKDLRGKFIASEQSGPRTIGEPVQIEIAEAA